MPSQEVELFPPIGPERQAVEAPIDEVSLFEDRARVRRRLSIALPAGQSRLVIPSVAPVLQDVSVQAEVTSGPARVVDVRARRSLRVRLAERPEVVRELDEELRELGRRLAEAGDARQRAEERLERVSEMLAQGAAEVVQDVAWGQTEPERWGRTFSGLFERARELREAAWAEYHQQLDLAEDIQHTLTRRRLAARQDDELVAWIALDVEADPPAGDAPASAVEIELEYMVPCALWRPLHSARLTGERLIFTSQAAVWQNTGEDWRDVRLVCSTARSSLGVEPPLLSDDLLRAEKKPEQAVVAAREVAVQHASVEGGRPAEQVDLPGVDDGGDTQTLSVEGRVTVPADGRPSFLPLFRFEAPAEVSRVLMAELEPAVFLRSVQANTSRHPVLAGPVELIREHGLVGWTHTLFVAPGERFELGFGPQDELRVTRRQRELRETRDPVKKTRIKETRIQLYLSNLADEPRTVEVTERIPVSEVQEVEVSILKRTPGDGPDHNGFCRWTVTLGPSQREVLELRYQLSVAPGVQGL